MPKGIALIMTLDTKAPEAKYISDIIKRKGHDVILTDTGILGKPGITPDISREEVAMAANTSLEEVRALGTAGKASEAMTPGLVKIIKDLYASGKLEGVISVGGGVGSGMASTAMRVLPVGFPKILVSIKIGQGGAEWYVGTKDVTLMPPVCDIEGLNRVTRRILANAAGAIVGMVEAAAEVKIEEKSLVVIGKFGITTACGLVVKSALEARGWEVVSFPGSGIGGRCQEEFIRDNDVDGVIELSVYEVGGELFNALSRSGKDRLETAGRKGIPQLITPGGAETIAFLGPETVPDRYKNRKFTYHNPQSTAMRLNADEMRLLGKTIGEKLNLATGPVKVLIPTRGFSSWNIKGREFYDPDSDREFINSLKSSLKPTIPVQEIDAHINDRQFAEAVVKEFLQLHSRWSSGKIRK